MKILLFNPPKIHQKLYTLRDEICFQDVIYIPFPIRLAQLASLLKQKAEVVVLDANAESLDWDAVASRLPASDILIFQSAPGLIHHDIRICDIAKRQYGEAVTTVMLETGVAPIYPERILKDFPGLDIVIRGQPESIVPQFVENATRKHEVPGIAFRENGSAICTPAGAIVEHMDALPFMGYDCFDMSRYSISYMDAPLHEAIYPGIRLRTTHDCPYGCAFCIVGSSLARGYDRRWKAMTPRRVTAEIEHVYHTYGIDRFFFWDETFTLDKRRAGHICDLMLERKLPVFWRCLTRIDCVDKSLLVKMAEAGCCQIEYGLEAGDPAIRKKIQKDFSDEQAVHVIRETREAGIRANCDLIIGLPWESRESLKKTLQLAKKLNADNVHLTMAFPYPETAFYQTAVQHDLLEIADIYEVMVRERVRVGSRPVARTVNLRSDELALAWKRMRKSINRHYLVKKLLGEPAAFVKLFASCRSFKEFFSIVFKGIRRVVKTLCFP